MHTTMTPHRPAALACAAALIAAAAAGCAAGTHFEWAQLDQVRPGQTEAQVVAAMGAPYARTVSGPITVLQWTYAQPGGSARAASVTLRDGVVVSRTTVGR